LFLRLSTVNWQRLRFAISPSVPDFGRAALQSASTGDFDPVRAIHPKGIAVTAGLVFSRRPEAEARAASWLKF
jgi:hypothetical protein